jgi:hypothetical protein
MVWLPPRHASIETHGLPITDLMECSGGGDALIVTDRFKQMWEAERLRGIEAFEPIQLVSSNDKSLRTNPPTLYYVLPPRDGTRLDDEQSKVIRGRGEPCTYCGGATVEHLDGIVLDPTTITGNDLFSLVNCNRTMLSPRAKEAFDRWAITHFGLIRDDRYGFDWRFRDMDQRHYPLLPNRTPQFEDSPDHLEAAKGSRLFGLLPSRSAAKGSRLDENQRWQRELDLQIVYALKDHDNWTPEEFETWIIERYQQPDVAARFPGGVQPSG